MQVQVNAFRMEFTQRVLVLDLTSSGLGYQTRLHQAPPIFTELIVAQNVIANSSSHPRPTVY
jgi:hypothetical protein